jgi:transcription initiation factor TFIID subunit 7
MSLIVLDSGTLLFFGCLSLSLVQTWATVTCDTVLIAMDDDLIVVDDVDSTEPRAGPSKVSAKTNENASASGSRSLRIRTTSNPQAPSHTHDPVERSTRSTSSRSKGQPKLKLKLNDKATATQAPGMSFLGQYDRELDSDEEDLLFEEQFILRMPPGEDCDQMRKMVQSREFTNDLWFKFKGF